VANLVPQGPVEVTVDFQVAGELLLDRGAEGGVAQLEEQRVAHDVGAQQDGAAVLARVLALVGQDGGGVGAARLTEVGDDVVYAHGNVLAHGLLVAAVPALGLVRE
jgi:hypothetical protein